MRQITPKQIIIDFDGTICMKMDPYIGPEAPGAIEILKRLKSVGHILILCTMRQDELLDDAIKWLNDRDVVFDYININPMYETGSRKIYSHLIIDDHSCCIPLTYDPQVHPKPFVNWYRVKDFLLTNKYL